MELTIQNKMEFRILASLTLSRLASSLIYVGCHENNHMYAFSVHKEITFCTLKLVKTLNDCEWFVFV